MAASVPMAESNHQQQMKIFLKIMKTIALDVHASDTIEDIKAKVCTVEGVGVNLQELFFSGYHLRDTNKTLADYNIPDNSTINLYTGNGMQIFVKISSSGKTLNLNVKSWDTIERVKAKIKDKECIPLEKQILFYLGRTLKDHETLNSCNIGNDSILQMVLSPILMEELQIFVLMTCGKTITLEVKTWYTVKDVKMIIESLEGFPTNEHKLVYAGSNLEDHLRLSEYKITDKSVLHSKKILVQIFVKTWAGKTVTVMVDGCDTITTTKERIEKKMGCNVSRHALFYAGKLLEEDKTLLYYNIHGGETVHLRVPLSRTSPCFILLGRKSSRRLSLGVTRKTTVEDVKTMIQEVTNNQLKGLKLFDQNGKEVEEDNLPIMRYGISFHLEI